VADSKDIQALARILNLQNVANGEINLENEKLSNKDYLYNILLEEVNIRNANKLKGIKKDAKLPSKVFDYTRITEGLKWQLEKIKRIDFTSTKQNIFIVGDCSTGKTSLASELGNDALEKGAKVIYITYDNLVVESRLKKKQWNKILECDMLILDDVFYLPPDENELIEMYKVLMFLQETRSIILITNRPLSSWKDMKVDTHLVETLEKRLMQDAQIISLA
jgi:DNA replication protein DnaC